MDKTILTPEESLTLIAKTIQDTKQGFKEISSQFILWGILLFITSFSQFILWQMDIYKLGGLPFLILPVAGIYTALYMQKKTKKYNLPTTIIGKILKTLAVLLGTNLMIFAFFFGSNLGNNLMPVFLILIAFWTIISGVSIKYKPLIIGGIVLNIIGFATFLIDPAYHPLVMSIASIVAILIPGIMLSIDQRRENV